ncbi:hypothetical protein Dimus_028106 [Dionaea muscipula]
MARWCPHCTRVQPTVTADTGLICCTRCGKVVGQDFYTDEPTFVKNASGQSQLSGNLRKTIDNDISASRARTLDNAQDQMIYIAEQLQISGGDDIIKPAKRFYAIALERNFTRGRSAEQVAAACLYISCREKKRPFLLIEFSDCLRVNVYVLGGVFLQLCKVLRLEEHPIVQKPVDPSLFMHRFTNKFLERREFEDEVNQVKREIAKTALHIIKSMKRDWMQTGRKPSGICGAALYISALSHGIEVSKSQVVKHVHICEATLTKRLVEFENTDSGSLTIEELNQKAEEWKGSKDRHSVSRPSVFGQGEVLCEHKENGVSHFAHGLCKECYDEFIEVSGGLDEGAKPPAFQRAERARMGKSCTDENANLLIAPGEVLSGSKNEELENETRHIDAGGNKRSRTSESGFSEDHEASGTACGESNKADSPSTKSGDESENFSDVDDSEVDRYLHTEEEKILKKRIWEEVNKEYLEEQAAKEAAAASFHGGSEEDIARRDLAAQTSAALAQSRKERRERRAAEAKKPRTAAEATHNILNQKRLSSKVNYDKLKEMFDLPESLGGWKKRKTESDGEDYEDKGNDAREEEEEEEDHIHDRYSYDAAYDLDIF